MQRAVLTAILALSLLSPAAARKRKVMLELDYTKRPEWFYSLDYRSECVITENDSTSRIKSRVNCALSARPNQRGDRMTLTVDSSFVESELFPPEQRESIVHNLTGATFGVALIGGCPVVDTLSSFSVSELSEWDLVIQFARLLPYIPRTPVKKRYKWDESGVFPVKTSLGTVYCDVYRLYRIDSIAADGGTAYISWKFKYAAAQLANDTSTILKKVPVSGDGKGSAVLDLNSKLLRRANVEFHTPVATVGDTKITWVENTILQHRSR